MLLLFLTIPTVLFLERLKGSSKGTTFLTWKRQDLRNFCNAFNEPLLLAKDCIGEAIDFERLTLKTWRTQKRQHEKRCGTTNLINGSLFFRPFRQPKERTTHVLIILVGRLLFASFFHRKICPRWMKICWEALDFLKLRFGISLRMGWKLWKAWLEGTNKTCLEFSGVTWARYSYIATWLYM